MKECIKEFAENGILKVKNMGPVGVRQPYYLHSCRPGKIAVEIKEETEKGGGLEDILCEYCKKACRRRKAVEQ